MNSKVTHAAAFLVGAVSGSAAVWQFAKKKYERIADEEISSVKESYSRREAVVVKPADDAEKTELLQPRKESVLEYAERLRRERYLPEEGDGKEEKSVPADSPYIISPDEFGDLDGYEEISLTYYADGTLADNNDEVIEDIDEIVGSESLTHFGEYEEDSVFVRNDKLKCDYEILLDRRTYSEILKVKPYLHREE